jgi:ribosomal protein L25 (general stress protein Ctc)
MKILNEKEVGDDVLFDVELSEEEVKVLMGYVDKHLSEEEIKKMDFNEKLTFAVTDILKKQIAEVKV